MGGIGTWIASSACQQREEMMAEIAKDGLNAGAVHNMMTRMASPAAESRSWYFCGCYAFRRLRKGVWNWRVGIVDTLAEGKATGLDSMKQDIELACRRLAPKPTGGSQ